MMRKFVHLTPLAAALALSATPALADPTVTVRLGPDVQDQVEELGAREINDQVERLTEVLRRTLTERGALDGARINLVLTDLKPNKPTMEQLTDRPGLDYLRSRSIGGAAFEGEIVLPDGRVQPVKYDWYTTSLRDSWTASTWHDADRAYARLADNLAEGRFVSR